MAMQIQWDIGYGKCEKVYEGASTIQWKIEQKKAAAAEAVRRRKEIAAAKKDQPALDTALKALGWK